MRAILKIFCIFITSPGATIPPRNDSYTLKVKIIIYNWLLGRNIRTGWLSRWYKVGVGSVLRTFMNLMQIIIWLKFYLDTWLWQADFHGDFFPHKDIWILCLVKKWLENIKLGSGEGSSFPSLFSWRTWSCIMLNGWYERDYENISKYLEASYYNFGLIFLSLGIILAGERASFLCAIKTSMPGEKAGFCYYSTGMRVWHPSSTKNPDHPTQASQIK